MSSFKERFKSPKFEYSHDLQLFEQKPIKRMSEGGKRFYLTETGEKYPSVTTCLGVLSKNGIERWKDNIGYDAANDIANKAAKAGTAVHNIAEKYILKEPLPDDPIAISKFKTLLPYLKNITTVYGVELLMASHKLKTAGTVDMICLYKGIPTILDFKTSRKRKEKDWIIGYFLQCTAYAQMAKEMYGFEAKQIVILMAVNDDKPMEFVEPVDKYINKTKNFFKYYHQGLLS